MQQKDSEDPQLRTYNHFYPEHWPSTCHWFIYINKPDHSHLGTPPAPLPHPLSSKRDAVSLWAANKTHIYTYQWPVQGFSSRTCVWAVGGGGVGGLFQPLLSQRSPRELRLRVKGKRGTEEGSDNYLGREEVS